MRRVVIFWLGLAPPLARPARADDPPVAAEATTKAPAVIDRIVAVVGDRLITASDVALQTELNARDPSPVPCMAARDADPLRALIDAAVIRGLAGQVPLYQPTATELRTRLAALRNTFEDPSAYLAFLARFGLTEDTLSGILFSRIVVERYVHRNVGLAGDVHGADPVAAEQDYEARVLSWRDTASCRLVPARAAEGGAATQAPPGPCP